MDYWGGGGGAKGMLAPPLKLLGGGLAPPGPPSSYAYEDVGKQWNHKDSTSSRDSVSVSIRRKIIKLANTVFARTLMALSNLFLSPLEKSHNVKFVVI